MYKILHKEVLQHFMVILARIKRFDLYQSSKLVFGMSYIEQNHNHDSNGSVEISHSLDSSYSMKPKPTIFDMWTYRTSINVKPDSLAKVHRVTISHSRTAGLDKETLPV